MLMAGTWRAAAATESELKAAFLFKFVAYTGWPDADVKPTTVPIVMGISADEAFVQTLQSLVGTNRVRGHSIIVRTIRTPEEAADCHLVFLSGAESGRLAELSASLKCKPVLLVGEGDRFCRDGGARRRSSSS